MHMRNSRDAVEYARDMYLDCRMRQKVEIWELSKHTCSDCLQVSFGSENGRSILYAMQPLFAYLIYHSWHSRSFGRYQGRFGRVRKISRICRRDFVVKSGSLVIEGRNLCCKTLINTCSSMRWPWKWGIPGLSCLKYHSSVRGSVDRDQCLCRLALDSHPFAVKTLTVQSSWGFLQNLVAVGLRGWIMIEEGWQTECGDPMICGTIAELITTPQESWWMQSHGSWVIQNPPDSWMPWLLNFKRSIAIIAWRLCGEVLDGWCLK